MAAIIISHEFISQNKRQRAHTTFSLHAAQRDAAAGLSMMPPTIRFDNKNGRLVYFTRISRPAHALHIITGGDTSEYNLKYRPHPLQINECEEISSSLIYFCAAARACWPLSSSCILMKANSYFKALALAFTRPHISLEATFDAARGFIAAQAG